MLNSILFALVVICLIVIAINEFIYTFKLFQIRKELKELSERIEKDKWNKFIDDLWKVRKE